MWKTQLEERSPLRTLERSVHDQLGPGRVGVITARPGVGKTACVALIAINELLHDRPVLHICHDQSVSEVRDLYDTIIAELGRKYGEQDIAGLKLNVEKHRLIHSHHGKGLSAARVSEAVAFLREYAHFRPAAVLVDGLELEGHEAEEMREVAALAEELGVQLWITVVSKARGPFTVGELPPPVDGFGDLAHVVMHLEPEGNAVALRLLKVGDAKEFDDLALKLDPTTMLLAAAH
jgi:hypothetical protein